MILTREEYLALGFDGADGTQGADALLTNCLKRSEYVLNGLTDGAAARTARKGGTPAEYVRQACGFQAQAMLRYEISRERETGGGSESESGSESSGSSQSSESSEKVTIGDFSYSVSSGSSSGSNSGSSSNGSGKSEEAMIQPFETDTTVIKLLRAAGCLFGAAEVRE